MLRRKMCYWDRVPRNHLVPPPTWCTRCTTWTELKHASSSSSSHVGPFPRRHEPRNQWHRDQSHQQREVHGRGRRSRVASVRVVTTLQTTLDVPGTIERERTSLWYYHATPRWPSITTQCTSESLDSIGSYAVHYEGVGRRGKQLAGRLFGLIRTLTAPELCSFKRVQFYCRVETI